MTVTNTSTLSIFTSPLAVPVAPPNTNANAVDATAPGGTLLGGVGTTYGTTNFESAPQNVVLTGTNNYLNVGGGAANIAVLGGGQIVESAQFLGTDSGKLISIELNTTNGAANASDVNAIINTAAFVSGNTVGSTETVAQAGGGLTPNPTNFYVHGGTGDDTIVGSFLSDFIRGGAGDDVISAFGGNDLVRGGSGSDSIDLGAGLDTLYYTSDQVVTGDSDTLTSFTSSEDTLVFEKAIDSTLVFSNGDDLTGYKTITFTSGSQSTTLNVVSGAIKKSDITFLS
ncbi:MAG: calcium-binding protein [Prochlorococcaceae cyanobacterium]